MWVLAVAIFAGFKVVDLAGSDGRARGMEAGSGRLLSAFWPGMDAEAVFKIGIVVVAKPRFGEWIFALVKMMVLAGATLGRGTARGEWLGCRGGSG